jgi:hypothetical protein
MTHPDVVYRLDTVGPGGLADEDSGAVGGAHPQTPYTPLPLDPKVSPGHGQGGEEFPAWVGMPMKVSSHRKRFVMLREHLERACRHEHGAESRDAGPVHGIRS